MSLIHSSTVNKCLVSSAFVKEVFPWLGLIFWIYLYRNTVIFYNPITVGTY